MQSEIGAAINLISCNKLYTALILRTVHIYYIYNQLYLFELKCTTCTAINNNGIIYIAIKPVFCAECVPTPPLPLPPAPLLRANIKINLSARRAHTQFNLGPLTCTTRYIINTMRSKMIIAESLFSASPPSIWRDDNNETQVLRCSTLICNMLFG